MSCQIKGIANIVDPLTVKNSLFGDSNKKFEHVPANELPLQNCHVSLSPVGDILALAWKTRLVILTSKWDSQEPGGIKNKFHITWNGEISFKQGEWITCLVCLPLTTLGKATIGFGSDWTCIAIGFNTGFIRFYTETGSLLLEEQLHNENIINIKCQTHTIIKGAGDSGLPDEIHVIYNSLVCILQGFSLFSTLRACRNHLAKIKANCDVKPPVTNIVCKKWSFKNQDILNDCEVIGTTSVNTFDHLVTASISGGFNANYRSSAPQHCLVVASGKRPFIGFHYALEGSSAPVLSDVAIAMASKVASAIGSAVPWFRPNSKNVSGQEKIKGTVNEPAEPLMCKFGLCDAMREGDCILASPNKLLSVVCDAMGRVILIDNRQGVAIRMWKGYRDAQCGWIETTEEKIEPSKNSLKTTINSKETNKKKSALFLVIYGPKKGVIDIWSIQHGAKVTTFSASRNGRLLNINYGLCGLNDAKIVSGNKAQYPCIFIDPLGGVKQIIVPFHFSLSSHNGNRARDVHLFKKLKTFLRKEDFDNSKLINEITNICVDLKTNEVRLQTIEMLMSNKHVTPDALLAAVKSFIKYLHLQDESDMEPASKTLFRTLIQLDSIIRFYKYIKTQYDKPPEYKTVASDTIPDNKQLSLVLSSSEREINRIFKFLDNIKDLKKCKKKSTVKVTFKEDTRTFIEFLSCFKFGDMNNLPLQKELTLDKKCRISKIIFQGWMYSDEPITKWKDQAKASMIQPAVLMELALICWLSKNEGAPLEVEIISFFELLEAICSFNDIEEICLGYNEVSEWWKKVRTILMESQNPTNSLTAAVVCKSVVVKLQRSKDRIQQNFKDDNGNEAIDNKSNNNEKLKDDNNVREEEPVNTTSDWENVSKDFCQFSHLIGNLEDVAILEAIVSNPPSIDYTTRFFTLPYEDLSISLSLVLSRGKGSVSEIVARWLSSSGLDPTQLIDTTDIEFDQFHLQSNSAINQAKSNEASLIPTEDESKETLEATEKVEYTSVSNILDKLTMLKRYFPYSLSTSVLLSNLCWEFVMAWNKDIKQLEAFEAALYVLPLIPVKRVRHGVCCLLWNLHVKKRMESASKLINKLGKLPKERLCLQDIGLTDLQLTIFLQHCVTFLSYFLDAEVLEEENCSFIRCEQLWEGHVGGPLPFAALAVSQNPAWYDLIILHLQLANVLHMMAHFNLKVTKPISNLFDSVAHQYFFQDITNKTMLPWYKDDKRDNIRVEFLCRVITASMESIHQETTELNTYSSTQAILWMSKCQNQACMWKINNDDLRIHQVCQLYINGFDRLAEEVVISVNDNETLASKLLPIAGGRMMMYLNDSPDLLEEVSRISPTLTSYLHSIKLDYSSMILTNCSNEDTIELVRKIVRFLPETHSDYLKAQLMLDATFIYEGEKLRNLKK